MTEENEEQQFIIADKRKFNADGSLREGVTIEEPKPPTETPPAAPQTTAPETAPKFESDAEVNLFAESPDAETAESDEPFDESNIPGAENPASFANFLFSLASQAAAAMGLTESPATGRRQADLELSRYWVEVLGMLHEKTKGNLHPQEQKLFDGLLSDLRMQYVQLTRVAEQQLKEQAKQKFTGKDILGR